MEDVNEDLTGSMDPEAGSVLHVVERGAVGDK